MKLASSDQAGRIPYNVLHTRSQLTTTLGAYLILERLFIGPSLDISPFVWIVQFPYHLGRPSHVSARFASRRSQAKSQVAASHTSVIGSLFPRKRCASADYPAAKEVLVTDVCRTQRVTLP